jgi:hypothetical protein
MKNYKDFIALSEEDSINLADSAMREVTDDEELSDILLNLSLFTNGQCLIKHYPRLIEKEIFYPSEIYLHADENIAQKLIELIETAHSSQYNGILCCLAWIGTENVIDFFINSSKEKPTWTKNLYVLPIIYAETAGWTTNKNNQKRSLINPNTISLTSTSELFDDERKIETFKEREDECQFCKNKLTTCFELEMTSENHKTEFSTCLLCSCYYPFFMTINETGKSHWHEKTKKWEHLPNNPNDNVLEPIERNIFQISIEKRKPEYVISQFINISKSQIGGFPTWVQDSEYLDCPNCNEKMDFVGQIDMEDLDDEGIYYFHYCGNCKVTGTNYQQT